MGTLTDVARTGGLRSKGEGTCVLRRREFQNAPAQVVARSRSNRKARQWSKASGTDKTASNTKTFTCASHVPRRLDRAPIGGYAAACPLHPTPRRARQVL
jgi:hypothetical protein